MTKQIEFKSLGEKRNNREIRIRRVSVMMEEDIKNIAAHLGISVTDYLKVNLLALISNAPAHYRKPMEK